MASDTVPASSGAPEPPAHAPTNGIPQPAAAGGGWLAGALAAVDPARPTFDLTPQTAADGQHSGASMLGSGGSSADFHDGGTPAADGGTNSTSAGGQDKGVLRAFAHAAIERWRQGGQARLKALDIQKEKAKALQVKEARTSTVNRSEKLVGGTTGTNTSNNASKGSDTKTSAVKKDHASGGKTNGSGAGGRSGPAGQGGGAGRGNGSAGSGTGKQNAGHTDTKNAPGKGGTGATGSKNGPAGSSGSNSGAGKAGPQGNAGKPGKDGKTPAGGGSNGPAGSTSPAKQPGATGKDNKPPAKTLPKDTTAERPWEKTTKTSDPKKTPGTPGGPGGPGGGAGTNTGPGKTPTPGRDKPINLEKNPDTKGGDKTTTKPGTGSTDPKKAPESGKTDPKQTSAPGGTTVNTQSAREAGYRDGTRIGRVEAKVGAWRDGVADGRSDIKEAAAKEKERLDKARQQRKQTPPAAPTPTPTPVPPKPTIPPKPSTPPPPPDPRTILMKPKETPVTAPPATPVQVKNTNPTHLELGGGADRQFISRGEVRNLAGHQRNLAGRKDTLTKIAERAKAYQAHAQQQTKQITNYLEQARSAKKKGGEKVIAELARLEEASKLQEAKAAEVVKRAVRAADSCSAVSANLDVRYAGIYRAAADSPDGPAELNYYRDLGYAHA